MKRTAAIVGVLLIALIARPQKGIAGSGAAQSILRRLP